MSRELVFTLSPSSSVLCHKRILLSALRADEPNPPGVTLKNCIMGASKGTEVSSDALEVSQVSWAELCPSPTENLCLHPHLQDLRTRLSLDGVSKVIKVK